MSYRFNVLDVDNLNDERYIDEDDLPNNSDFDDIEDNEYEEPDCFFCNATGEGYTPDTKCAYCNGRGTIKRKNY